MEREAEIRATHLQAKERHRRPGNHGTWGEAWDRPPRPRHRWNQPRPHFEFTSSLQNQNWETTHSVDGIWWEQS